MYHSIKVNDKTYHRLQELQAPRESYDDVIARLINLRDKIARADPDLWPQRQPAAQGAPRD